MDLKDMPRVTEIARWKPEPGDRLIVFINEEFLSREEARSIARQVRDALLLPDDFPLLVATPQITLTVLNT